MRLNKYIARAGIASRREADRLTIEGKVKINGAVMTEPGYDVSEDDEVTVNGVLVPGGEKLVYYALNKPAGYITTTSDEYDRPTIMELVQDVGVRVFPVGRLDADTRGLIIMTNDGDLSYHLSHPSQKVFKKYLATVEGQVSKERLWTLRNGVDIGGYVTQPARVSVVKAMENRTVLSLEISEGKNRQIRKMCKAVGNPVLELQRVAIGPVNLGHLHEGSFRKLSREEVDFLKNC